MSDEINQARNRLGSEEETQGCLRPKETRPLEGDGASAVSSQAWERKTPQAQEPEPATKAPTANAAAGETSGRATGRCNEIMVVNQNSWPRNLPRGPT